MAGVLRGKRILLWKQMLESIEYEDMEVVNEFASGTRLVGEAPTTGLWPKKFKPASLTESDLSTISILQRSVLTYRSFEFMDEDTLKSVWNQTIEEVEAGELSGPFGIGTNLTGISLEQKVRHQAVFKGEMCGRLHPIVHQCLCSDM